MKLMVPNTKFRGAGVRLASRPGSLRGKTVGFLDGWGFREADGSISMYPLMRELKAILTERHGVAGFVWLKKGNVAQRAPKAQIAELVAGAHVIINGEAA
jgi:hypothetical protein